MEDFVSKIADFIMFLVETIKHFVAVVSGKETDEDETTTAAAETTTEA